jgi:hypothetical protein
MDREATVIREEMNHTKADLDQKLSVLEARARRLRPSSVARRYLPDYPVDRAIGAVLTLIGTRMAWSMWRQRANRRARVQQAFAAYRSWDQ